MTLPSHPPHPPRKHKAKHQRMAIIVIAFATIAAAVALMLFGLKDNIVYFHSPSAITADPDNPKFQKKFRIGGIVKINSLTHNDRQVQFILTDQVNDINITYEGILPALFREGQGIVALGTLTRQKTFIAEQLLAKHDENYMPAEAIQALKDAGVWQGQ